MWCPGILLLCIQACLVQVVLSQCTRPYSGSPAPAAIGVPLSCDRALDMIAAPFAASVTIPFTEPFLAQAAVDAYGVYGGAGIGQVAVVGDLPAAGTMALAGQVPILGAAEFRGIVPAAGTVSIVGTCACGCPGPYIY